MEVLRLKPPAPVLTAALFTRTPAMAAGFGWPVLRQGRPGRMALAPGLAALALWLVLKS